MTQTGARTAWLATVLAAMLAAAGCASGPTVPAAGPASMAAPGAAAVVAPRGRHVEVPLDIGDEPLRAHWYLPDRTPAAPADGVDALLLLQHGFSRRCSHLRQTSLALMDAGLTVLCIDAPMAGGNPVLAARLGDALSRALAASPGTPAGDDLEPPDGRRLPARVIVGGHSAGARFAASLGDRLASAAPGHVAGALLFDPVATAGFDTDLRRIADAGRRPVLALFAPPHACNARLNGWPAVRQVRQDALDAGRGEAIGIVLVDGGTHADVEGEDSDWLAAAACGRPLPANVSRVRMLAIEWAVAVGRGASPPAMAGDTPGTID